MANSAIKVPELKDILATGLQFGHTTSRWNSKMKKYIYTAKNGIHIIDVMQSRDLLGKAVEFLTDASSRGSVIFVGTKRQAAHLVQENAVRAGGHFIVNRWPGGMLTNFNMSKRSLDRLKELERQFEEGVEGRTKFEVSKMKSEWERLNRIYGGVKTLTGKPTAVIIIDPKFERVALREARKINVPVVALADTNCDPSMIDYIIPGNDDALRSIEMVITLLADAVLKGNEGKGVVHVLKDYTNAEVKLLKQAESEEEKSEVMADSAEVEDTVVEKVSQPKKKSAGASSKGILERVKDAQQDASDAKVTKSTAKKKAPATKKVAKKK